MLSKNTDTSPRCHFGIDQLTLRCERKCWFQWINNYSEYTPHVNRSVVSVISTLSEQTTNNCIVCPHTQGELFLLPSRYDDGVNRISFDMQSESLLFVCGYDGVKCIYLDTWMILYFYLYVRVLI